MAMLESDLRFDIMEEVVPVWGEVGVFRGMRTAYLSRSAGNGWMWTASPERDYSEQSLDLSLSSGVKEQSSCLSLPGFHKCKSECVCEKKYTETHGHPAGACSRCSNQDIKSRTLTHTPHPTPNSSTNHVHGRSRRLSWPLRTMIHLCAVLINHISLTQPPNSVERLAPCLTY